MRPICFFTAALIVTHSLALVRAEPAQRDVIVFAKHNLVAWCIVPFDAKKRGPAERAEMIKRLGISKVAYDWRDEHVPTFEEEILEYKKLNIEYFAFWSWHDAMEPLIKKHGITPQIWSTNPSPRAGTREGRIQATAKAMLPLVEKTRNLGLKLGLYNHGGWGGEPENLVAVCEYLRREHKAPHVGIVYNFHHGHGHIVDFAESLRLMQPYLLCLNLNGMVDASDVAANSKNKILPIGFGKHERKMIQAIRDSGYAGPIGILDHRNELDAEESLHQNLTGLEKIVNHLGDDSLPPISARADGRRPNVVFFLVDDLGWRDLGCYGSNFFETPNIDRFAEQGVRFTQAYAACHVCSPTRASIMTGKYPARLHLTDWLSGRREFPFQKLKNAEIRQHLPLEEITIADALKEHRYRTAHIGKWHLGEDPFGPLQQGFDLQIPRWNKGWPKAGYHTPFEFDDLEGREGEYLTDRLTDEAEKFIEANKEQPFFLYLSHFAVHDPIQGRHDLVEKYRNKLAKRHRPNDLGFILEGNPDDPQPLSRQQLTQLIRQPSHSGYQVLPQRTVKIKQHQDNIEFAAMVEAMDESLGRVLAKLEMLGLSDNTLVIFFSDNGGMSAANFGRPSRIIAGDQLNLAFSTSNLPLRGAKGWLYEGGIRVPLIIKWPHEGQRGTVCDVPVISTDFCATILEMVGLPLNPEQHADGVSIAPLLKGATNLDREAIYWHFPHYSNHGMQSPGGAVRAGDYKLLEYYENNTAQLFNLRQDIGEQNDLSKVEPEKVAELRSMLHAWRRDVSARMMVPNPEHAPTEEP